jgi:glycosyltransferase involved in cell wall biosynthesis
VSAEATKSKLRVVTLSDTILGGAEDLARQVAQRIDRDRFESTLVATRWTPDPRADPVLADLEESGTRFIGMSRGSRFDLRPWRRLLAELREQGVDILHTHKIGSNLWGALLKPRIPAPVFVTHEHTWSWEGQLPRRLIDRHLIARRAAAVVAVSRADQRRMSEIEHIPPEKTRFIPVGIPPPKRSANPADLRAELGMGPDQPLIGMVGTLRPQKNYELMFRATQALKREFPGLRVAIAGAEESAEHTHGRDLQALIDELGLSDTITLLGFRTDVYDVISQIDVGAQSSDFEGSPQSVLEMMEAAKPVVATSVGGMTDMVIDGETGILVEPGDMDGLAEGVAALLRDPERAAAMGRAGQELRRREFTMEHMISLVEQLYEELWARHEAGRGG